MSANACLHVQQLRLSTNKISKTGVFQHEAKQRIAARWKRFYGNQEETPKEGGAEDEDKIKIDFINRRAYKAEKKGCSVFEFRNFNTAVQRSISRSAGAFPTLIPEFHTLVDSWEYAFSVNKETEMPPIEICGIVTSLQPNLKFYNEKIHAKMELCDFSTLLSSC